MKHNDIPSFKDPSIDFNLSNAIKKYNPKQILEVGVGLGSSTWNILDSVSNTIVYALDKFEFNTEPYRIEKIKEHKFYYEKAKQDKQIVNDAYEHYNIFCWLIDQHQNPCFVIKQDIWDFIENEKNTFDFVFLDNQKYLPVLLKQLEFFADSVICGTGYTNEHNKKDVDLFSVDKKLFVDNDFWIIDKN